MGDIRIEVEYFKDGYPVEGDFNDYGINNFSSAVYIAEEALAQDVADAVAFYVSLDEQEPTILEFSNKEFTVEKVSEKINETIKHLGA